MLVRMINFWTSNVRIRTLNVPILYCLPRFKRSFPNPGALRALSMEKKNPGFLQGIIYY